MAMTKKFVLHAVQAGATMIGGITDQDLPVEMDLEQEATSGDPFARFVSLRGIRPGGSFSTSAIATAISAISIIGADIAGWAASGFLNLWLKKVADAGTIYATNVHRKHTFRKGLIVPERLTIPYQGNAQLTYRIHATYDGVNAPVTVTVNQALPGLGTEERFTLGGVLVGGLNLTHMRQVEIDFGVNVEVEGADNDVYPSFCSITRIMPRITFRGVDPEWFADAAIPLTGKAAVHANTAIYLQRRAAGGTLVAPNQAQHIKFTADGLAYAETLGSASGQGAAEPGVAFALRHDGTNAPLLVTLNTIIV